MTTNRTQSEQGDTKTIEMLIGEYFIECTYKTTPPIAVISTNFVGQVGNFFPIASVAFQQAVYNALYVNLPRVLQ